jgi:hypothetical protein
MEKKSSTSLEEKFHRFRRKKRSISHVVLNRKVPSQARTKVGYWCYGLLFLCFLKFIAACLRDPCSLFRSKDPIQYYINLAMRYDYTGTLIVHVQVDWMS